MKGILFQIGTDRDEFRHCRVFRTNAYDQFVALAIEDSLAQVIFRQGKSALVAAQGFAV